MLHLEHLCRRFFKIQPSRAQEVHNIVPPGRVERLEGWMREGTGAANKEGGPTRKVQQTGNQLQPKTCQRCHCSKVQHH